METSSKTSLRQANAKVRVVGIVSEKKLEMKTENGMKRIEGSITVKTSDTNFVQFHIYCNEKNKQGEDNRAFDGLVTVMNEYQSIADVGEADADKVRVNGQLNFFTSQNGNNIVNYNSNFFNRIKSDEYVPEASFELEMFIKAIVPEVDTDGEETGRVKIVGWVPTYNGIEPVELIVEEENASGAESTYEPGMTAEFYGDIINNRITKIIEKPVAFGKPKKEVKNSFVNELVVNGGSEPYDPDAEDEAQRAYDKAVIKAAIAEREHSIQEARDRAANNSFKNVNTKPSGASRGRTLRLDI